MTQFDVCELTANGLRILKEEASGSYFNVRGRDVPYYACNTGASRETERQQSGRRLIVTPGFDVDHLREMDGTTCHVDHARGRAGGDVLVGSIDWRRAWKGGDQPTYTPAIFRVSSAWRGSG